MRCKCYEEITTEYNSERQKILCEIYGLPPYKKEGRCNGTKNRELCYCNGEESMCTYYPRKNEKNGKQK